MRRDSLWWHRNFRLLWLGDTVSQFGSLITQTSVPLLGALVLLATPLQMGLLTAADQAAFLLIGLPAGVWVDRMRRRPVMITADLVRAVLLLSVPLAWWRGVLTIWQLIVVGLLVGVLSVFFDVSYQSYLPALVGREHLVEGNGKLQASQSVAQVSGPAISGWLAQGFGAANAILVNTFGYLWSAACLARIDVVEPRPQRPAVPDLRAEIAEGLRFVLGNRSLRGIVSSTATCNFCGSMTSAVGVLLLTRQLGASAGVVGTLLAGAGIGGVIGAVTSGRIGRRFGQARTIWLSLAVTQPFTLLIPLTGRHWGLLLYAVGGLVGSFGAVVYNVAQVSFRQAICPDRLLGRMNASVRFMVWGTIPLGGLTGGVLGQWAGIRPTLWIAAIGACAATLFVVATPLRGMRDLPTAPALSSDEPVTPETASG